MNTKINKAPSASSKNQIISNPGNAVARCAHRLQWLAIVGVTGVLMACASGPQPAPRPAGTPAQSAPTRPMPSMPLSEPAAEPIVTIEHPAWQWADEQALPAPMQRGKSQWEPVRWADLPGWGFDALHEAWSAWLRSCERPAAVQGALCPEVRQLSISNASAQHEWVMRRLQPYRVTPLPGAAPTQGLLTGYYEPVLSARRLPDAEHTTPLHGVPASLRAGQPWFSREQMMTLPEAQAQLKGLELLWLADPIDALLLQIQGSGRMVVSEPDGSQRTVRLAFAGHNGHPYRSVARWLLERGHIREGSWEAIRAWALQNPERVSEMLASNPRTVFFREEPLSDFDAEFGPRGAQGVALTPGRSIAVDRDSIPYGTPVWLHTSGPHVALSRLVLAQDTGSAIVGAVRADFFTGWGDAAYTVAAGIKQPLQLWVLWPRP